ncbi:hypothetical protein NC653_031985 [Populus alba x Populus x berolinensis]|uniref:Uncharacterized protein n=1 Tax=Populus alba x Populus x berolinensis TaxID=444605 RepID=A0AAD6Q450_9ROSI|nr:hypothetical protein NC653_031985 [Populus alba x Populus x berolinensis]
MEWGPAGKGRRKEFKWQRVPGSLVLGEQKKKKPRTPMGDGDICCRRKKKKGLSFCYGLFLCSPQMCRMTSSQTGFFLLYL